MSGSVSLFSRNLEVRIIPAWGGKTVSVWHRHRGLELLFQSPRSEDPQGEDFASWAFGWDDCWPSVNAGGIGYPDHGALWRMVPTKLAQSESSLTLEFRDHSHGWSLRKQWNLDGEAISVAVEIRNTGNQPLEGFWTLHALVRAEPDQVLLFPGADRRLTVWGADFFPRALPKAGQSAKFWIPGPVAQGFCGVLYPSLAMEYVLNWDPRALPYLGLWSTNGGFQGDVNQAWEPSNGFYDSVATARALGTLPSLPPGGVCNFGITLIWRDAQDVVGRATPRLGPLRPSY